MDKLTINDIPEMFEKVAEIFAEKKEELCEMDAAMGDGDLGLTMSKGYGALPGFLRDNAAEGDVGKMMMKGAMKMQNTVPSTMGTLMSSGIMSAAKEFKGKTELEPTILDRCTSSMSVTQDESFGPVLTVETFEGADRDAAEVVDERRAPDCGRSHGVQSAARCRWRTLISCRAGASARSTTGIPTSRCAAWSKAARPRCRAGCSTTSPT